MAAIELGDAAGAIAHLRRAVAIAEEAALALRGAAAPPAASRSGAAPAADAALAAMLRRRAAEARMSLSLALTLVGESAAALAEADRAEPALEGHLRARLQGQRAVILQKLGRLDEALDGYRGPLAAFRRAGDALWEARLLCNRGVLEVYRGALAAAEADFQRAEALHESIGQGLAATQVRHNLGWVAARRGDVPLALERYDRAEAEYREHGVPLALLLMDRCEVLLSARLAAEARANAEAAVAELEAAGLGADLAEARLLAAQADLLAGDIASARDHATRADHAFGRQHRPGWAALARVAAARAAWAEAESTRVDPTSAAGSSGASGSGGSSGAAKTDVSPSASGAANADGPATASGAADTGVPTNANGAANADGPANASRAADEGGAAERRARLEVALGAAQRALRALEAVGWGVEALDARLIAGRAALELGRTRLARHQLELATAARHRGPVQVRTRAWHAAALLRLSHGDRRSATAAVAAGLRALEAHRMTLGASELRAHASGHGEELATLGLRLAVESGSARRVLAAAERRRAASLLQRPARPPDEPELASDLEELRGVTAALDEALRDGRPRPDLARRQAALEQAIRRRALRAPAEPQDGARTESGEAEASDAPGASGVGGAAGASGVGDAGGAAGASRAADLGDASSASGADSAGDLGDADSSSGAVAGLGAADPGGASRAAGANRANGPGRDTGAGGVAEGLAALGARALVEFMALDGRLLAVTVVNRRARLHDLGPKDAIEREVGSLRFALRSVAAGREKMAAVCEAVAAKLDGLLVAPLNLRDHPLVIVPTGELHALPWSLLPSLKDTPVSVVASLRLWARATRTPPADPRRRVYVAGPRLPAAREEVAALQRRHPDATTLTDDEATINRVTSAIDGADHAHVAAHGRFRDDNPLFTSLELADGNVTVYDLERLRDAPRQLVLASCETGLSAVHAGDELMGFTAAVFALGTQTVIAAVVPVPDEATKGLMLHLDEELTRGETAANALVNARRARPLATSAFVCFGAG